ncbi:hypothetical protein H2200_008870 [Cladophialophora chaetospira]|uniref:Aminoglycoside phosphotransferase domain-containing protein n=1 Tax=Cladophialophora chaetospira TaxID=386627 RepID=A0AA38X5A4_9EURO|nr:hypothetical protein H2200_008870 [Cladophialophora chaetospira]
MGLWFALTGARPVFPFLANAVLTLLSLALALPICIAATIKILGTHIVAFCELARPEPSESQSTSSDETCVSFSDRQTWSNPEDNEFLQTCPKSLYDDKASIWSDHTDPVTIGKITSKSVDRSMKPTKLFLEAIDCSPLFSESELFELLHNEEHSLRSNNSEDGDRKEELEFDRSKGLSLSSDVPFIYCKLPQTEYESFLEFKANATVVEFGNSSAAEAKAGNDLLDPNEKEEEEEDDDDDDDDEEEDDDDDGDEDDFAEVKQAVDLEAIKKTAILCRAKQRHLKSEDVADRIGVMSCEIDNEPMYGSYNLVYVLRWSDGVKWVIRIPKNGCRFAMLDVAKMESTYETMKMIRKKTTMPIPQVYFHTWVPDRAGVPFALMSYVEGKMLFDFWHHPTTTGDQKLTTLTSIAKYMADLSKLKYSDMGMLYFDHGEAQARVGPVIETFRRFRGDRMGTPELQPRCNSIKAPLSEWLENQKYRTKRVECQRSIFRAAIDSIPDFMQSKDQYTACFPDFDWQNIMVNDNGEITAFIDWDDVEIKPISCGAGRYPNWLTRDWQPATYGPDFTEEKVDDDGTVWHEDSPDQLSIYRQHYLKALTAFQEPGYDSRCTKLSHILATLSTGIYNELSSGLNINKLFRHAGIPFQLVDYGDSFIVDDTAEKDQLIQQAFKKMWHAEWEEEEMEVGDAGSQSNGEANAAKDEEV